MDRLAPLLGRTLVVAAHPDDETVGCGALLQRMREPVIVFATDGAPRDDYFWRRHGSRDAYAHLRTQEARSALGLIGACEIEFLGASGPDCEMFVDQELFRALPEALERLRRVVRSTRPEAMLTLAYEGGHPDHDACSLLIHLLALDTGLQAWEMPLYHRSVDGLGVRQEFLAPTDDEILLEVTAAEVDRKRRMCAAYASQGQLFEFFDPAIERFRPQAAYDYASPPHSGLLNYEAWQWPMTGAELSAAFARELEARHSRPAGAARS